MIGIDDRIARADRRRSRRGQDHVGAPAGDLVFVVPAGAVRRRIVNCPRTSPARRCSISSIDEFVFRAGPIFTQVRLADEINRVHAKTEAALLEAMQVASGDGGRREPPAPRTVLRARDAEPGGVGGDVPDPRGAAGPVPPAGADRIPNEEQEEWILPPRGRIASPTEPLAGVPAVGTAGAGRARARAPVRRYIVSWSERPVMIPSWPWARALARWYRWATRARVGLVGRPGPRAARRREGARRTGLGTGRAPTTDARTGDRTSDEILRRGPALGSPFARSSED